MGCGRLDQGFDVERQRRSGQECRWGVLKFQLLLLGQVAGRDRWPGTRLCNLYAGDAGSHVAVRSGGFIL